MMFVGRFDSLSGCLSCDPKVSTERIGHAVGWFCDEIDIGTLKPSATCYPDDMANGVPRLQVLWENFGFSRAINVML